MLGETERLHDIMLRLGESGSEYNRMVICDTNKVVVPELESQPFGIVQTPLGNYAEGGDAELE